MAGEGIRAGRAFFELVPRLKPGTERDVERQLGNVDGGRAGSAVGGKFGAAFGRVAGAAAGIFAAKIGVDFFRGAIDSASNLNETISKTRTIFGGDAAGIEAWGDRAAKAIGQSKDQALGAASSFGNMFVQLGIGTRQAGQLSTSMVELASDFASFHNADISEVLNAQQAAFRGEYDSVQRFLPLINAANVEQRALAMTGKSATDELTAQDKALAVHQLMLEGAGDAAGDFARTSDGLANKQRILSAEFENAKARIGQALLPIVTRLVSVLADNLGPALDKVGRFFRPIVETAGKVFEAFKVLGGDDGAQGFAEIMDNVFGNSGKYVGFFRELATWILRVADFISRNLQPILIALGATIAVLVSPIGAVVAALVYAYTQSETFRNIVNAVVEWLSTVAVPAIVGFVEAVVAKFAELVAWVREHWASIQEAITHVVNVVRTIIETAVAAIELVWRYFGDTILAVISAAWENIKAVVEFGLDFIRGLIEFVLAIINGEWGKAWEAITGILGSAWDTIKTLVGNALDVVGTLIGDGLAAARDAVSTILGEIVGFFAELPGRLLSAGGDLFSWIMDKAEEMADWVLEQIDRMLGPLDEIVGKIGDVLGKGASIVGKGLGAVGGVLGLADGGHVTRSGLTLVGERGAEILDLPGGSSVVPLDVGKMIAGAALAARSDDGGAGLAIEGVPLTLELDGRAVSSGIVRFVAKDLKDYETGAPR